MAAALTARQNKLLLYSDAYHGRNAALPYVFLLHLLLKDTLKALRYTLNFCRHCFSIYHFLKRSLTDFQADGLK